MSAIIRVRSSLLILIEPNSAVTSMGIQGNKELRPSLPIRGEGGPAPVIRHPCLTEQILPWLRCHPCLTFSNSLNLLQRSPTECLEPKAYSQTIRWIIPSICPATVQEERSAIRSGRSDFSRMPKRQALRQTGLHTDCMAYRDTPLRDSFCPRYIKPSPRHEHKSGRKLTEISSFFKRSV